MEQTEELLQGYSDQEKAAYLGAIATIATADHQASAEESEFLQALAQGANLSEEQEQAVLQAAQDPSNISLQKCLDTLKNSDLRFSLITDVIAFAKIDGKYSDEEQVKIQEMAAYLNIDQSQFSSLNQFVSSAENASQQGQDVASPQFLQSSGMGDMLKRSGINSSSLVRGAIGILAPIVLSRMLSGGRRGRMGGGFGGGLGGGLGGILGSVLGGGMRNRGGMGGFGSIFDVLSSGRGYRGMGGLLGGLLGGGRRSGGGFGF